MTEPTDFAAEFIAARFVGAEMTDAARKALNTLDDVRAYGVNRTDPEMMGEVIAAIEALRAAIKLAETPIAQHVATKVGRDDARMLSAARRAAEAL